MKQTYNTTRSRTAGISLIETLVALALFSIVSVISISTLLSLVDANRKAQSLKSVMTNLNFALDGMVRTIATGRHYFCHDSINPTSQQVQDCPDGAQRLILTDDTPERVGYRLNGSTIERQLPFGTGTWMPLTASEVAITDMQFYVTGSDPGFGGASDPAQPTVTVLIRGSVGGTRDTDTEFNIQTTVTQRLLDE